MRKLLLSAVVVSLALGLAGCDDAKNKETNTPSAAKSDAPKAGGSLIIGITSGDPLAVNPLYASDRTTLTIMQALYAPLYSFNNGKIEWGLAESLTGLYRHAGTDLPDPAARVRQRRRPGKEQQKRCTGRLRAVQI